MNDKRRALNEAGLTETRHNRKAGAAKGKRQAKRRLQRRTVNRRLRAWTAA